MLAKKLKQELNHSFVLKKVHRVIKFNQEAWLKTYINMKTQLRKKIFKKIFFFKLLRNEVFRKNYGEHDKKKRCEACYNRKEEGIIYYWN